MKRTKKTKEVILEWEDFDLENLIETLRKHAAGVDNAVVFDELGDIVDFTETFTDSIEEAEVSGELVYDPAFDDGETYIPADYSICLYSVNIKFDGRKMNLLEALSDSGVRRLEGDLFPNNGLNDD